jgi:hypothetical protein
MHQPVEALSGSCVIYVCKYTLFSINSKVKLSTFAFIFPLLFTVSLYLNSLNEEAKTLFTIYTNELFPDEDYDFTFYRRKVCPRNFS